MSRVTVVNYFGDYDYYVSTEGRIGCYLFSLSAYRYLGDGGTIGVKLCMMINISPGQNNLLPFWERYDGIPAGTHKSEILGLNCGHLTAIISKTVSRSVTFQLDLNVTSTTAF